ncbi:MAG: hypothetical protein RL385_2612 [Pseudomonadota bacterium]|jgi:hypothetical protein
MNTPRKSCAVLSLTLCLLCADARAQERQTEPASGASAQAAESETEREHAHPMGEFSVTLRAGFGHVLAGSLDNPTYSPLAAEAASMLSQETLAQYNLADNNGACTVINTKCRTPARNGVLVALTLHAGGDGFGWDLEPYVLAASKATSFGLYTGPSFDIHVLDPLYFGFGFGGRVGYVAADHWKYGADIFGRIPAHVTWYVHHNLALEVEGAFGAGITGYASEPIEYTNPQTGKVVATAPNFRFGASRAWDLSIGIRFP